MWFYPLLFAAKRPSCGKNTYLCPIFQNSTFTVSLMNDKELHVLVERMTAGDRDAFNAIFRRFYAPTVRFCFRFVADTDVAAEIVQDLFVKLCGRYAIARLPILIRSAHTLNRI